jgi:hypothetical protein
MALKSLQSLVLRVAASSVDRVTGLERKVQANGRAPALQSYPRLAPCYPMADTDVRPGLGGAHRGTAQPAVRAGRPGSWLLARNPRGTIQSGWSRPRATVLMLSQGFSQARDVFGRIEAAIVES